MIQTVKKQLCLYALILLSLFFFQKTALGFFSQATPLPAKQAFQLSWTIAHDNQLKLHWQIAQGYHLYKDKFHFSVSNAQIAPVRYPEGQVKTDNILGNYQFYTKSVDLTVQIIPFNTVSSTKLVLFVTYQGCSEANFCYPPVTEKIKLDLNAINNMMTASSAEINSHAEITLQDKVNALLKNKNYFLISFAFLGFGLLLAFTPCVLPMIPILSSIIVGQSRTGLTARKGFLLSLCYVMGMSVAYAVAGILVALAGSRLTEIFQAPWIIVVFSLIFFLLALSLFGLYDLRLPNFLHHRVIHLSNKQQSGSYLGTTIMGVLSVLIVSPCVTAPLVGVLTFIAQTGDIMLGSTALFALGIGMGLPLLIIGTTEGKFLPKSGPWMHIVKSFFGILLICVAINLLQRLLPSNIILLLYAAVMMILAVYLGVGTHHRHISSGWLKFGKGLGLFLFSYSLLVLIGAAMGNTEITKPLANVRMPANNLVHDDAELEKFSTVSTLNLVNQKLAIAKIAHKPVIMDFYADWCIACHEMDNNVFSSAQVKSLLKNALLLRIDITRNNTDTQSIQDYFKVIAPPTVLFFDATGKELPSFRLIGSVDEAFFVKHLKTLAQQASGF